MRDLTVSAPAPASSADSGAFSLLDVSDRFVIHAWSDEAVVFDTLSGDTHLLDPVAASVVLLLAGGRLSRNQLLFGLAEQFVSPPDEGLAELTEATLSNLQRIGLVLTLPLEDL